MTEVTAAPSAAVQSPPVSLPLADLLLAVLVGGAAFYIIVGPGVLDVTNMLWLAQGQDSFQHYIGWEFFRRSPWAWPPGANPDFGLQFSSSIIFSDSIPLLALPLKLLSPLLPQTFQYTGWWTLACFLLQAFFAARLVGCFTRDAATKLALVILLIFAPPMLWRLSLHFSLVAHWVILASIYLYFAPASRWRWLHWIVLLGAAVLIHTYLFGMCVPIWLASVLRRRLIDGPSSPHWFLQIAMVFVFAGGLLWLGGFFPLRVTMIDWGYGYYRTNLLSLVNPEGGIDEQHWQWSSILPGLPHALGDYEGFAYEGLGGIAAIALALPLIWTERGAYRGAIVWPLVVATILLFAFAVSPAITAGDRQLMIDVPNIVYNLASTMRSSGRFVWPVYYLLVLGAAWLIHRSMGARIAGPLLLVLAVLQVYDTYPGWSSLRPRFDSVGSRYLPSLDSPELAAVAAHYRAVRMLPAKNQGPGWQQIASFALLNHLPTDAAYVARPDYAGYNAYMARTDAMITRHELASDSLYFLNRRYGWKVAGHMTSDDAMFKVGDFYVFAPGWKRFKSSTALLQSQPWAPM